MMVLKSWYGPDAKIRAARVAQIGSYATHETSLLNFLKFYENIGVLGPDTVCYQASEKLTEFYNANS